VVAAPDCCSISRHWDREIVQKYLEPAAALNQRATSALASCDRRGGLAALDHHDWEGASAAPEHA
jgi:hypothetical protein